LLSAMLIAIGDSFVKKSHRHSYGINAQTN